MSRLAAPLLLFAAAFTPSIHATYIIGNEPEGLRQEYCNQQTSFCENRCQFNTFVNTCNINTPTLAWTCLCEPDRQPPKGINATAYPIPYFTCIGELNACVTDCKFGGDCIDACRSKFVCGLQTWDCKTTPQGCLKNPPPTPIEPIPSATPSPSLPLEEDSAAVTSVVSSGLWAVAVVGMLFAAVW
ncbi:hypothetical protein HK102_003180 [Quaeritorhiza haematococci]|nr:hypothetical protein HK102_003180 [Quaeritorhiza haematococci]